MQGWRSEPGAVQKTTTMNYSKTNNQEWKKMNSTQKKTTWYETQKTNSENTKTKRTPHLSK